MKPLKEQELTALINNATFIDYLNRLRLLATSLFSWENLDDICGFGASRFLEQILFEQGKACFVNDTTKQKIGMKIFRVQPDDKFNIYELPVKVRATSIGYNEEFDFDEIVYIMNNELQLPTLKTLELIAYRLYETERTIDINLIAHKTPILIEGDTKSILTLKNVYMQYSGNTPFIFGNKQFDVSNKLNVLKTDAPYLIDKLELHKHELWNEALSYLGIDNANTDKKERLITDEVESNNQLINFYLNCFYKTRKQACELINEKFLQNSDKKINIKLNNDLLNEIGIKESEVLENGEIYNNNSNFEEK